MKTVYVLGTVNRGIDEKTLSKEVGMKLRLKFVEYEKIKSFDINRVIKSRRNLVIIGPAPHNAKGVDCSTSMLDSVNFYDNVTVLRDCKGVLKITQKNLVATVKKLLICC